MKKRSLEEEAALEGLIDDPNPDPPFTQEGRIPPSGHPTAHEPWQAGPIDIRGQQDWLTIWSVDTSKFEWGSIQVNASCSDSETIVDPYDSVHAQCRIIGQTRSDAVVMSEAAIGHHQNRAGWMSAGPFRFVIPEGEMPDRIEVQVRARRGGLPMVNVDATETLSASLTARFR